MPVLIFISYSHQDVGLVQPVVGLLRATEDIVFQDLDSIVPGRQWRREIEEALHAAQLFVLFWCYHSSRSAEVKKEYEWALTAGKDVLPVLLDRTSLPAPLNEFQWVDFRHIVSSAHRSYRRRVLPAVMVVLMVGSTLLSTAEWSLPPLEPPASSSPAPQQPQREPLPLEQRQWELERELQQVEQRLQQLREPQQTAGVWRKLDPLQREQLREQVERERQESQQERQERREREWRERLERQESQQERRVREWRERLERQESQQERRVRQERERQEQQERERQERQEQLEQLERQELEQELERRELLEQLEQLEQLKQERLEREQEQLEWVKREQLEQREWVKGGKLEPLEQGKPQLAPLSSKPWGIVAALVFVLALLTLFVMTMRAFATRKARHRRTTAAPTDAQQQMAGKLHAELVRRGMGAA